MDITITPRRLRGTLEAPPSKSAAHRALICAALCREGESVLHGLSPSQDILATLGVLRALGAKIDLCGGTARVTGIISPPQGAACDCRESGSTLRFLLPVAGALGVNATFLGAGNLPQRPYSLLAGQMERHGAAFSRSSGMPFSVIGRLRPGWYELAGDVSSQYVSGLLFALPLLERGSDIALSTPLQSAGYVEMTVAALRRFGVDIEARPYGWHIPGRQRYHKREETIEADYSNAAFWLSAGALGSPVACAGLDPDSPQGDRAIVRLLQDFGATAGGDDPLSVQGGRLHACRIDASQVPDLVPILAVVAALSEGETLIENAGRLRIKECDRLAAMADCLTRLGAKVCEGPDYLRISGAPALRGGEVSGWGDHRIVMACAIAATRCEGPVTIRGAQAVEKSYPDFFTHYRNLGGKIDVL